MPNTAESFLQRLQAPDGPMPAALEAVYGPSSAIQAERRALLIEVLEAFLKRFGNKPLRLFRCPGRINLRGMHVDTHGGYLNLMTHQREVVAAVTPASIAECDFVNTDPNFDETRLNPGLLMGHLAFQSSWREFIMHPVVREEIESSRGHWSHYLKGALLSVAHRTRKVEKGLSGVIGSDLPRGASLSSSAALCVAMCTATAELNHTALADETLVGTARDAEWYTGSRCGLSDQTAMVLGGINEVVNLAIRPGKLSFNGARRYPFPDDLRILVVNSYTERSLSGAATVDYTRNRFAYSLAMEILRQEALRIGADPDAVKGIETLADLSTEKIAPLGGLDFLYRLLRRIPEVLSMAELLRKYDLPDVDLLYIRYFGTTPEHLRPMEFNLRGPLLFGIAESERARMFPGLLLNDAAAAGRAMSNGHDGDRKVCGDGAYAPPHDDASLRLWAEEEKPVAECPGSYGASSRALDALVDCAMGAGALGASLTGAGIAGSILVLCAKDQCERVSDAIKSRMSGDEFAEIARRATLSPEELEQAVVVNSSTAAAGEIVLP